MRKIFYCIFLISTIFTISCTKTSYVAKFDELPQERMSEQMALVQNTLTQAKNGWIGLLTTNLGGGYSFYMTFDTAQFVNMYADLTDVSATEFAPSRYRIKADMGADLVFDTYNYITLLNDPEEGTFGGDGRDGFKSDIDFIYDHSSEDSIIFIGKRYRQTFSLVKASAAQAAVYLDGGLLDKINGFKDFFVHHPNAYVELDGGIKASVEANSSNNRINGKRITITALNDDGSVNSTTAKFAYTLDKMAILDSGATIEGVNFTKLAWSDAESLAAYTKSGKEYIIKNAQIPILPLFRLWGTKYNGMISDYKAIYPGTSPAGAEILNSFHDFLDNHDGVIGFPFNYGSLSFDWDIVNKRMTLEGFSSQNGGESGWATDIVYNYTVNETGVYQFTLKSGASGGYVAKIMDQISVYLLNNKITFDYYLDGEQVYAKMSSTDSPEVVMTFELN